MSYDFIKLTDVDLLETPNESTNVIVEHGGDVKRIPTSAIGAQADWNETDATNPAYILNKPTSLGGYAYYTYYNYYLYKCADRDFELDYNLNLSAGEGSVSKSEFENDYYSRPIMFKDQYMYDGALVISYNNYYNRIIYSPGDNGVEQATVRFI